MTQRTKDTINWLINKELQQEYSYQLDNIYQFGEYDDSLIRDLIDCERDLFYNRSKGLDRIIQAELIKDDIEKYIKDLEEHYKYYKEQKGGEENA